MVLDKILKFKKKEVAKNKKLFPISKFKNKLKKSDKNFKKAISSKGLNLIAEIKKVSPSEGLLSKKFDFEKIVKAYNKNKHVKALSILTDAKFFGGGKTLMDDAKKITKKPILGKDFIIDEYQVYESRFYGADAILLIASILSKNKIKKLIKIGERYNMDCLVEVHNKEELKKIPSNADIIGINNRDLKTFKIRLDNTINLIKNKKIKNKVVVSESGFKTNKDIKKVRDKVNAVLIGTTFMKAKNINKKIKRLMK